MEETRGPRAGAEATKLRVRRQPKPPDLTPEGFPYFLVSAPGLRTSCHAFFLHLERVWLLRRAWLPRRAMASHASWPSLDAGRHLT